MTAPFAEVRDHPLFVDDGCPLCARPIARHPTGRYYRHLVLDPADRHRRPASVCPASGRTFAEARGVTTVRLTTDLL